MKQGQIAEIGSVLALVNKNTPVVFLQNGMAHLRLIDHIEQPILLGVVDHGASKTGHHSVSHTGKGTIRVAAFSKDVGDLLRIVQALHQSDFPVYQHDSWSQLLAEKLIVNAVINPVTAIFDTRNGAILRNPHLTLLAKGLCEEAAHVLNLDPEKQWRRIQQVACNTAENTSSMLKDLKAGRETELEAITGYLIETNPGGSIPNTWFVYHSVKALEGIKGIIDEL